MKSKYLTEQDNNAYLSIALAACNEKENEFDASGTFEADEVIVSSELTERSLRLM